jgi:CBS-domain-containing membrane protein
MTATATVQATPRWFLSGRAGDFMAANVRSVRADATLAELAALLIDRALHAVPVIDDAGRPVGVVSKSDLLVHAREGGLLLPLGAAVPQHTPATTAGDLMTPAVFAVAEDTPAHKVLEQLTAMQVHQLFVVDRAGTLVGVIHALDVLRQLRVDDR